MVGTQILCFDCKEQIIIGKWLRNEDFVGVGFSQGGISEDLVTKKIVGFLAKHVDHKIIVASDGWIDRNIENHAAFKYVDADFDDDSFCGLL